MWPSVQGRALCSGSYCLEDDVRHPVTLVGFCFILYCSAGFLIPVSSGFPEFWNPFCVQAPALLAQFEISAPASISDHSNYLCVMVLGGYVSIQVTPMSGIWLPVLFFHAIRCAWWLGPSVTPMCFYSSPKCAWYKCLDSRFYSWTVIALVLGLAL